MASKQFLVEDVGEVTVYKRRGARSIKLSLTHDGKVRVSMPLWAPYKVGLHFVNERKDWIVSQRPAQAVFANGSQIGMLHKLVFLHEQGRHKVSVRSTADQITVKLPFAAKIEDDDVQKVVRRAAIRALKAQAEAALPGRLKNLAGQHGFTYASVEVKQLKSRWGSCNSKKEIVLNCFLMQLPWELIDYVLLHELTHTVVMAHGPKFWLQLGAVQPELDRVRKAIKAYQPTLLPH